MHGPCRRTLSLCLHGAFDPPGFVRSEPGIPSIGHRSPPGNAAIILSPLLGRCPETCCVMLRVWWRFPVCGHGVLVTPALPFDRSVPLCRRPSGQDGAVPLAAGDGRKPPRRAGEAIGHTDEPVTQQIIRDRYPVPSASAWAGRSPGTPGGGGLAKRRRTETMLQSLGKVSLFLRFRRWICVCVRKAQMDARLREQVRALRLGSLLCWCDRSDAV